MFYSTSFCVLAANVGVAIITSLVFINIMSGKEGKLKNEEKDAHRKSILLVLDGKALSTREIVDALGGNWRKDGKFLGEISQVVSEMEFWRQGKIPVLKIAVDKRLKPEDPMAGYHPHALKYYRTDQEKELIEKGLLSEKSTSVEIRSLIDYRQASDGVDFRTFLMRSSD